MTSYDKAYFTKRVQIGDGTTAGTLGDVALTPLEVTLTIDGCGGIFPGNTIHTSYIPKKYKDRTALIIKSVSHEISNGGWTTTLETMMTAAFNLDRYGKIETPDKAEREFDVEDVEERNVQQRGGDFSDSLYREDGSVNENYFTNANGYVGKAVAKNNYDPVFYYGSNGEALYQKAGTGPKRNQSIPAD